MSATKSAKQSRSSADKDQDELLSRLQNELEDVEKRLMELDPSEPVEKPSAISSQWVDSKRPSQYPTSDEVLSTGPRRVSTATNHSSLPPLSGTQQQKRKSGPQRDSVDDLEQRLVNAEHIARNALEAVADHRRRHTPKRSSSVSKKSARALQQQQQLPRQKSHVITSLHQMAKEERSARSHSSQHGDAGEWERAGDDAGSSRGSDRASANGSTSHRSKSRRQRERDKGPSRLDLLSAPTWMYRDLSKNAGKTMDEVEAPKPPKQEEKKPRRKRDKEAFQRLTAPKGFSHRAGPKVEALLHRAMDLDERGLRGLLKERVMKEARRRCHVHLSELMPTPKPPGAARDDESTGGGSVNSGSTTSKTRSSKGSEPSSNKAWEMREKQRKALMLQLFMTAEAIEEQEALAKETEEKMQKALQRAFEEEQKKLMKAAAASNRVQSVVERENQLLQERRKEFEAKQKEEAEREARLAERHNAVANAMRERAAQKEAEIARVKKQREQQLRSNIKHLKLKLKEKEARAQARREEAQKQADEKKQQEEAREAYRSKIKEDVQALQKKRAEELRKAIQESEARMEHIKTEKEKELEMKRHERLLMALAKREKVERSEKRRRLQLERQRQELQRRMQRVETVQEVKEAVLEERKRMREALLVEKHKLEEEHWRQRNATPGPGEYTVKSTFDESSGFRFSKWTPKTDLDMKLKEAQQLPGPGQYVDPTFEGRGPKASFGWSMVPSELDKTIARAEMLPAPGEYGTVEYQPDTPAFSLGNHNPKSDLDWKMIRASELPGPGQYGPSNSPERPKTMAEMRKELRRWEEAVASLPEDGEFLPPCTSPYTRGRQRGASSSHGSRTPHSPLRSPAPGSGSP